MSPLLAGTAAGKLVAFAMGVGVFFALPNLVTDLNVCGRWAILFWYPSLGGIIGISNVVKTEPIFNLRIHWWQRAPILGAWMNLMVVLFAYEGMREFTMTIHFSNGELSSPFWFVLDGVVIGVIVGYVSTKVEQWHSRRKSILDQL